METDTRELLSLERIPRERDDSRSVTRANEKPSGNSDGHNGLGEEVVGEEEEEEEYITGFRLMLILSAGTLVQFVMMLDQSIIATVGPA